MGILGRRSEPQLGRRGLYRQMGGGAIAGRGGHALVLNLSDGELSLLDIAERSRLVFGKLAEAAEVLAQHGLLRKVDIVTV